MIKNIIATSLVAATLVFSGCGSDEGEAALSVQQKLDKRDFVGAINALQGKADTDGKKMQLGSAYMGAAGLSTTDLVRIMDETTNTTSSSTPAPQRAVTATNESDSFARFAEVLQRLAANNPKMLEYLSKAIEIFEKVSGNVDSNSIGFAKGLANTAKATTVLSYFGDIGTLGNGVIDGELRASSCAILYMYADKNSSKCKNMEPIAASGDQKYNTLIVTVTENDGDHQYTRLVSGTPGVNTGTDTRVYGHMLLNDGYIDVDGNGLADYPKAVLIDGEPVTVQETLVSALNEGFKTILESAPEDTKDDILEYKREMDSDNNGEISASEIAEYLAK